MTLFVLCNNKLFVCSSFTIIILIHIAILLLFDSLLCWVQLSLFCTDNQIWYNCFWKMHVFNVPSLTLKIILYTLVLAHLFVKLPQPGNSEATFSIFKSSLPNHSKIEAISLTVLPKDTTICSPYYPLNAEQGRDALEYQLFMTSI